MGIGQRLERLEKATGGCDDPLIVVTGDADVPTAEKLSELGIEGTRHRMMRLHGPDTAIMVAPNGLADIISRIDGKTRDILSGRNA